MGLPHSIQFSIFLVLFGFAAAQADDFGNSSYPRATTAGDSVPPVQTPDGMPDAGCSSSRPMLQGRADKWRGDGQSESASFFGGTNRLETSVNRPLFRRDFHILSSRDVIIIIDQSASMSIADCPAPNYNGQAGSPRWIPFHPFVPRVVSRWEWCKNELMRLSQDAGNELPNGIRVVLFNYGHKAIDGVRLEQIPKIFQHYQPWGWTFEGSALQSQLNWYFENKDAHDGHVRPIVIAVITDGLPISPSGVRNAIIKATERMEHPDEIAITFLQIGTDRHGVKFVHQLDDKLIAKGARYDIVDCKDFEELQRIGLAQALVDAINEASFGAVRAGSEQQERNADISSPQRRLPIEAN